MHRLSSQWTFYYKQIFPVFWFGGLVIFVVVALFNSKPSWFLIAPIGMAILGLFIMNKFIFDLVDEVWEDGNTLVVKNKGVEERILFTDIKNVNCSKSNPERITLTLRAPNRLGSEISFHPLRVFYFLPNFSNNPIAAELIDKIDRARQS